MTIFIRTLIVYLLLVVMVRLMGKRQLGELEVSELVTTILISEIASLPIADQNIPLVYAVIPLVTILTLEVSVSVILLKCPRLKNLVSSRPNVLIRHGVLNQAELRNIRISLDELISEIRQAGLSSLADVDYAILEQNGKISVIPRKGAQAPTANDLKLQAEENGIMHVLIEDGRINRHSMKDLNLTADWLQDYLTKEKLTAESLFFLGRDDGGNLHYIKKEENR